MARRKKQDEEAQDNFNNESDDSFGLPEVEYEPLKREEEPQAAAESERADTTSTEQEPASAPSNEEVVEEEEIMEEESNYNPPSYTEEEERPSVLPKVLLVLFLLAVVGAAVWYFGFYRPEQEKARFAQEEKLRREAEERRKSDAERLAALKREEDERRRADSLANLKPAAGTIETLSDRTGRYYIVVASAIDDDLIADHAKKLSNSGVTCYIIPPFGKTKFSRLAIDYKDTYADAQATADGMKGGDYGNEIWVVKY
ncbi:MAG TPA: hypothetical protein VIN08_27935 [Ohtaekwangia sp.]|uniref:hypothetical protein n=1 Tax=Ohtaekwangia sp. TaxID=2066019 RepID=UPI002F93E943